MAMLKKISIKNDILPRLLSEEFTEKYFTATKFRGGELEKKIIELISNEKILHSIVIANKVGISPVEAFLENYQIVNYPLAPEFEFKDGEEVFIGTMFGFIFQFIFGFSKDEKRKKVEKLGIETASYFNTENIIIEIIE
jgi:flagellar biosynthetic protein FliR